MNIFVTGGAGYVGSHCVRGLCDAGHQVAVYDNLAKGHRRSVDERATLIVGDLADAPLLNQTLTRGNFDAVMHFAAFAEVGESVSHPLLYYRNNVINSVSLLEAMRAAEVRKLVFSSTCAIYGVPRAVPITEDMPHDPINPYGRTKLAIEWALQDSMKGWGLGATALRYFNAAGASPDGSIGEDHDPESHLIPRVLKVALGQADGVKIFGIDYPTPDGSCVRDYVHVADLAEIHRVAIETQEEKQFRCYNVGTGQGVSVKEVIDAAREITGHEIPAAPAPRRDGDPPELYADPTKITTDLAWDPKYTDIRATIQTAWNWHRNHPDGFAS
ncbi:MAG: UDP-glucose 4-epimerase GalE [Phycisphaerae bacterium]|jgi:UDP-glucose 4-epimerase